VSTVQAASGSPCQWWHLAAWAARARRLAGGAIGSHWQPEPQWGSRWCPLAAAGSASRPKVKAEPGLPPVPLGPLAQAANEWPAWGPSRRAGALGPLRNVTWEFQVELGGPGGHQAPSRMRSESILEIPRGLACQGRAPPGPTWPAAGRARASLGTGPDATVTRCHPSPARDRRDSDWSQRKPEGITPSRLSVLGTWSAEPGTGGPFRACGSWQGASLRKLRKTQSS
jgi:hypothetical protein